MRVTERRLEVLGLAAVAEGLLMQQCTPETLRPPTHPSCQPLPPESPPIPPNLTPQLLHYHMYSSPLP